MAEFFSWVFGFIGTQPVDLWLSGDVQPCELPYPSWGLICNMQVELRGLKKSSLVVLRK